MTESAPPHPFDDMEALTWLRSQPDGRVTASAAELGRQWGWNRMRTGRRLKTWEMAGLIRRNAEAIIVTTSVTPAVTGDMPAVTGPVDVTSVSGPQAIRRSASSVRLAALVVALALAGVSAAFSIDGLTAIFAGAFWPVVIMGAVLEAGKLVAAAWLTEHWNSAPSLLRLVLVAMVGVLMGLNAIGVFGFLTRAHLDHMASIDLALADRTADIEARLAIQGRTVADLDRRIAQIDTAIEESTRLGRPLGAMTIADQRRRERAEITAQHQHEAQALGNLQIDKAKIDARRKRAEAEVGPVRYIAEVVGIPATDLERAVRLVTLALVAVLDPMAVALLLAAGVHTGAKTLADLCPAWHRQPRHRTKCWPDPRGAKPSSPSSVAGRRPGKSSKVFSHTLCTCGADASRADGGYTIRVRRRFPGKRCLHLVFNRRQPAVQFGRIQFPRKTCVRRARLQQKESVFGIDPMPGFRSVCRGRSRPTKSLGLSLAGKRLSCEHRIDGDARGETGVLGRPLPRAR